MSGVPAFADPRAASAPVAEIVRPRRQALPSVAAAENLRNDRGAWDPGLAPMMAEPLDLMASRRYTGIAYIGPARSSKTFSIIHGSWTWAVAVAPGDTLIVQMSQDAARDFSKREIDMVIENSPEIGARLSPLAQDDNIFDKQFRSGMSLKIGWPALSQLSSKTLRYVLITDYDRPENRDDVDGQGRLWDLAAKRVETYLSRGKVLAESSPGETIGPDEIGWRPSSPHEGPPVLGIVAIYNRGTRARWYWACLECGKRFQVEPGPAPFRLPPFEELERMVRAEPPAALARRLARVPCPHCGYDHRPEDRLALNAGGIWLHEGDRMVDGNRDESQRRPSSIASYWLGGAAATHQGWEACLQRYLAAIEEYSRTADEGGLRGAVQMDLAGVHIPRALASKRSVEALLERTEPELQRGQAPELARFLIVSIDVQAHKFAVGVMWFGPHREWGWVDRFDITGSRRPEGEGFAALDPGSYSEDWKLLEDLLTRRWPVQGAGHTLRAQAVLCDSGGAAGVTTRAYEFWRDLRRRGMLGRFHLTKGDGRTEIPRVDRSFPDTRGRSERKAAARGDVPVWILNVNSLKDTVAKDLEREERGPGFCHLPGWAPRSFFEELTAEVRGAKIWEQPRGKRNETWDLAVMGLAGFIIVGGERINWASPPTWAAVPPPAAPGAPSAEAPKAAESRAERIARLARDINRQE